MQKVVGANHVRILMAFLYQLLNFDSKDIITFDPRGGKFHPFSTLNLSQLICTSWSYKS